MGARSWVRFYPHVWRAAAETMSRMERSVYFDVCWLNWKHRGPVSRQAVWRELFDIVEWEEIVEALVAIGAIHIVDGLYTATAVRKMLNQTADPGRIPSAKWKEVRVRIFERDNHTCQYCGAADCPLECDHVIPLSRGGSNDDDNLKTACRSCNRRKHAKLLEEWAA